MKIPKARGKEWLVACRDDLSGVTECKALAKDRAKAIAKFFYYRIIMCYGIVLEVVTDNGPSFQKDFRKLLRNDGIKQISISPSQWPSLVPAACYADRITVRRATGYSPYYLLHEVHPFLPCDLTDATFMVTEFHPGMTDQVCKEDSEAGL